MPQLKITPVMLSAYLCILLVGFACG